MQLKQLFNDEDAVSPVIGVILMVAITVILAAVIGTFVLGLGDRVSQAQPSANFQFSYSGSSGVDSGSIDIGHNGGDAVTTAQLSVQVDGVEVWKDGTNQNSSYSTSGWSGEEITAGDSLSIDEVSGDTTDAIVDGDSVKVVWTASGSDKTAVIGESEVSL